MEFSIRIFAPDMSTKHTRSLLLPLAALVVLPMLGQVPNDQASYDAWKLTQVLPGDPIVITPEMLEEGLGGFRNNCDCWIEPDGSYTTVNNNSQWNASNFNNADDGSHGPINLPFVFQLYGQNHTQAFININGNISFGTYYGAFSASGFPVNNFAMVAPFWADVDLRGPGAGNNIVRYKVTPTALYVNWINVGYFSMQTDKVNNFQVIITNTNDPVVPNGANVSFCYKDMQWTTGSASSGVNGFGGIPANVGANRGNGIDYIQFGRFDQPGMAYDGPFGANDGVDWLDDKYFTFATDLTTANIPPVVTSQSVCDSMVLCVGETATMEIVFLSPEPNQTTIATSSAPTLSNYDIISNTQGITATILTEFTPLPIDVGYHIVTFEATDNGVPAMTTTYQVIVEVQQGDVLDPGEMALCETSPPYDMLTLLPGAEPGGSWTGPAGANHPGTFDPATDSPGDYLYSYMVPGGGCASYGTVAMSVVEPAHAGNDGALVVCTTGAAAELFPLLGGGPDAGGYWLAPNGLPFGDLYDPAIHPDGDYRYVAPGAFPCPNDTAMVSVSLMQAVNAGENTTLTLCQDAEPLNMLAALLGDPDDFGAWTNPSGAPTDVMFEADTDPVGEYTYTVPAVAPCPDESVILTIATDPLPWAGTDASVLRCADAPPVNLFGQLGGAPNNWGYWLDPAGNVYDGLMDPTTEPTGTHLYIVVGIGTCEHLIDTAQVVVTINPLPEVGFTLEPLSGCDPLQVFFTNTTPVEYLGVCQWAFGDGSALESCDDVSHWYENPGSYAVGLTVTTPEGCTDDLFVPGSVLVEPAPQATFFYSPDPGTEGNSTIYFTADDPHAILFEWTASGVPIGNTYQVYHTFPDIFSEDHEVCLRVVDQYGCEDVQCQMVPIVVPMIAVPNAFTPDGDGVNDVFLPVTIDVDLNEHLFEVYDRWGQLVFRSTAVGEGWDGRHMGGGEILPQGVYVWRLTALPLHTSDKVERQGTVTLIK